MKVSLRQEVDIELWIDNVKQDTSTLPDTHLFTIEIQDRNIFREEEVKFKALEKLLPSLKTNTTSFEIYYKPDLNTTERFLVEVVFNTRTEKTLEFKTSWKKEGFVLSKGRSSYRDVNYFMPKWSSAYKNEWSTHSKFMEPLFSNLKYLEKASKIHLQSNYDEDHEVYVIQEKSLVLRQHKDKAISTNTDKFVYSQVVKVLTEQSLDFGHDFNDLMVKALDPVVYPFELILKGEYEHQPISETLIIDSNGIFKPKKRYNKISYIGLGELNLEHIDIDYLYLEIGNKIDLVDFNYEDRKDVVLEQVGNRIQIRTKDLAKRLLQTFTLPLDITEFIYVDSNDNIFIKSKGTIYTGKLDAKINLDIERDMTFNNTKFIETCYLEPGEYSVDLYIQDFQSHANTDLVAVKLTDSSGSKYLDEGLDFKVSDTPLYIPRSIINLYPKISLDVDLKESDFLSISLIDYESKTKVSNLIVNPIVSLKPEPPVKEGLSLILSEEYPELPVYSNETYHLIDLKPTVKVYFNSKYLSNMYLDMFGQIPLKVNTENNYVYNYPIDLNRDNIIKYEV